MNAVKYPLKMKQWRDAYCISLVSIIRKKGESIIQREIFYRINYNGTTFVYMYNSYL